VLVSENLIYIDTHSHTIHRSLSLSLTSHTRTHTHVHVHVHTHTQEKFSCTLFDQDVTTDDLIGRKELSIYSLLVCMCVSVYEYLCDVNSRFHKSMYVHVYTHTHIYTHEQEKQGTHIYYLGPSESKNNGEVTMHVDWAPGEGNMFFIEGRKLGTCV
jgi:hypothetical protein